MKTAVLLAPLLFILACSLGYVSNVSENNNPNTHMKDINIVPKPTSIKAKGDYIDINKVETIIVENNSIDERNVAELFQSFLKPIKGLGISSINKSKKRILISLNTRYDIPEEGYTLSINGDQKVDLKASSVSGLFYGFQSFRQLCDPELETGS